MHGVKSKDGLSLCFRLKYNEWPKKQGACVNLLPKERIAQLSGCWFSRDKISFEGFYWPGMEACLG